MSPLAAIGGSGGGGDVDATGGGVGDPTREGVPAFVDGGDDATGSNGAGFDTVDEAGGGDAAVFGGGAACATGGLAAARAEESLSSRPG